MRSKNAPEINAGSMADIAFLLLVFFLVTTTMDSEFGMTRKLPSLDDTTQAQIRQRNILEVWINSNNEIMVQGKQVSIAEVSVLAKEFILNSQNAESMPEKKLRTVPLFGEVMVSKQVISLKNDNNTSYGTYLMVQNELSKAYNDLRNELANQKFGKDFKVLKEEHQIAAYNSIKMIYPQRISEAEPFME